MRSNHDPNSCILVEDAKVVAPDEQMARDSTASIQTPTEGNVRTSRLFYLNVGQGPYHYRHYCIDNVSILIFLHLIKSVKHKKYIL